MSEEEKKFLEIVDLKKGFGSGQTRQEVLRGMNFSVAKGEFCVLLGPSGSGKSTLLNIIGGMDTFDEGEMFVDGEPTFQYDDQDWEAFRRNKIGYIFQDYSLVGHYTALDNVMSALLILGVEKKDARETAMKYLAQVGLAGYETHRASELSSGQKQRLSIARALAKNTEIIVADEPTGNLDSKNSAEVMALLRYFHEKKGQTLLVITHDERIACQADRLITVEDGHIAQDEAVRP